MIMAVVVLAYLLMKLLIEKKKKYQSKGFKSEEQFDSEWREKFGEKGAKIVRETVDRNMADYHYLKQFAIKG